MSSAERFVRHHKRQTDRVISQAYAHLATNACVLAAFDELLHGARARAPRLLDAPIVNERHPGVDALVNLARFNRAHIRRVADWAGTSVSWRAAVSSLAQHLVCIYPVPRFLAEGWYDTGAACAEKKREWFVAHGRGASFRSLDLPIDLTRKMEHIFLLSRDHLSTEQAIRRAELLALGGSPRLVREVLATQVAADLRNGEFWRSVWMFLVANEGTLDYTQVGPLIDFVQALRHERVTVESPAGVVTRDPPEPSFSMKGRTMSSMLRLMQVWHRSLGMVDGGLTWAPSPLRPMLIEEPNEDPSAPRRLWQLTELTNGAQLRGESAALHHCVATYADSCWRGWSRIWSLRMSRGSKVRHVLTVQVDMRRRAIVQARGWCNRPASGKALRLLQEWSVRERLRLSI